MTVPRYHEMFNAVLDSLRALGGSASVKELEEKVAQTLNLNENDLSKTDKTGRNQFGYNLGWTRSYLKSVGLIESSGRGIWSLTNKGTQAHNIDPKAVIKNFKSIKENDGASDTEEINIIEQASPIQWEDEVLEKIKALSPKAFEVLAQRMLRESGFIEVDVTGKSGDGGIDGKGIMRMGLLSFHVYFQCKRYKGCVGSPEIRNFRGAMTGRKGQGLFITTGSFTRDAEKEATRDGAPPIELVDGMQLVTILKDLRIGMTVKERIVEDVTVNSAWFDEFNAANS